MKNVLVIGLGKSGISASRLLAENGDKVLISDMNDNDHLRECSENLVKEGIVKEDNIELGGHTDRLVEVADLVVVSPGVNSDSSVIKTAENKGITVISEIELAYSMCMAPVIAVTGTSGKTTVTTLIGQMLERAGFDAIVCGNIGNPFSGEINRINRLFTENKHKGKWHTLVVLEVSSFQLERVKTFKPIISVILNISSNHLDRHSSMEEYVFLKSIVYSNQNEDDIVFLNGKDKVLREMANMINKTKVEYFDEYKDFGVKYNIKNENYLAAMSAASFLVSDDIMLDVISGFKGIEHRLEYVANVEGVDIINDSKATTISSVKWALEKLEGDIILIMGGRYKGGDFGVLEPLISKKVKYVIVIGEASLRILRDLASVPNIVEAPNLQEAVKKALSVAKKGYKLLLSPGCSSFDMFKDYKERGRIFKEICLCREKDASCP